MRPRQAVSGGRPPHTADPQEAAGPLAHSSCHARRLGTAGGRLLDNHDLLPAPVSPPRRLTCGGIAWARWLHPEGKSDQPLTSREHGRERVAPRANGHTSTPVASFPADDEASVRRRQTATRLHACHDVDPGRQREAASLVLRPVPAEGKIRGHARGSNMVDFVPMPGSFIALVSPAKGCKRDTRGEVPWPRCVPVPLKRTGVQRSRATGKRDTGAPFSAWSAARSIRSCKRDTRPFQRQPRVRHARQRDYRGPSARSHRWCSQAGALRPFKPGLPPVPGWASGTPGSFLPGCRRSQGDRPQRRNLHGALVALMTFDTNPLASIRRPLLSFPCLQFPLQAGRRRSTTT